MMLQRRSLSRLRTFRHIVCRAISVRDVAAVHRKQGPLVWLCESRSVRSAVSVASSWGWVDSGVKLACAIAAPMRPEQQLGVVPVPYLGFE